MKLYAGIDLHSNNSVIHLVNKNGKEVLKKRAVQHCLSEQIKVLEKALQRQVKLKDEFIKLTSIDGIGVILALTIMLETGETSRFRQAGNYASPTAGSPLKTSKKEG